MLNTVFERRPTYNNSAAIANSRIASTAKLMCGLSSCLIIVGAAFYEHASRADTTRRLLYCTSSLVPLLMSSWSTRIGQRHIWTRCGSLGGVVPPLCFLHATPKSFRSAKRCSCPESLHLNVWTTCRHFHWAVGSVASFPWHNFVPKRIT